MAHPALALSLLLAVAAAPSKKATPSAGAKPAAEKAFPYPTEIHALKNGLRVVFVPYDSPGLVAYYTLMRVGSRNEPEKGRSGYAHFFEHMMFRGTKAHPGEEYNATVTRLGLNTNAFTSEDMTVYHLYGPAQALPTIIEYEGDRFQNLDYSEAQFKTEAGAILGEYAKSASNPEQILVEKVQETAFDKHTYRHTTIGYLADVKNMPSGFAYSHEFFKRYYTPDNATIVIVGDFDKAATLAQIEKWYGGWKGKVKPAAVVQEPPQKKAKRAALGWETPTLPRLVLTWHAPSSSDLKSAAVQNLLNAYLFGPTSALYQDLILGRQLVDSIDPYYNDHRDAYLFGLLARVKKPEDLPAVELAVLAEVKSLAAGKVDRKRLEAVRSNLKYGNILALDKADSLAVTLAVNAAQTGDVEFLNKEYAAIDKLTPADLSGFAKRFLVDSNKTAVTLVSGKAPEPSAPPAAAKTPKKPVAEPGTKLRPAKKGGAR